MSLTDNSSQQLINNLNLSVLFKQESLPCQQKKVSKKSQIKQISTININR